MNDKPRIAIADDNDLVMLSAEPRHELLPVLNRSEVMSPLVFFLAFVPGITVLVHAPMNDAIASWGIRCLDFLSASGKPQPTHWFPGHTEFSAAPLQEWLGGWLYSLPIAPLPDPGLLVSFLSVAALVLATYFWGQRLYSSRLGFLTVLLLACHPETLKIITHPESFAMGMAFALCSWTGILSDLRNSRSIASWALLAGGLCWGLCLLSGGPLGIGVVLVLLLHILLIRGQYRQARTVSKRAAARPKLWRPLRSVMLLVITGAAFSSFWILMMFSRHGADFWSEWLWMRPLTETPPTVSPFLSVVKEFLKLQVHLWGILGGLTLFGLAYGTILVWKKREQTYHRPVTFLLIWWVTSTAMGCLWSLLDAGPELVQMWSHFSLLASLMIAAWAIIQFAEREIGPSSIMVVVIASFGCWIFRQLVPLSPADEHSRVELLTMVVMVLIGSACLITTLVRSERSLRVITTGLILLLLVSNAILGVASWERPTLEIRQLHRFRMQVSTQADVQVIHLVSQEAAPLELVYVLRSLAPTSNFQAASSWEQAITALPGQQELTGQAHHLLVEWTSHDFSLRNLANTQWDLVPLNQPWYFQQKEVRGYLFSSRVQNSAASSSPPQSIGSSSRPAGAHRVQPPGKSALAGVSKTQPSP